MEEGAKNLNLIATPEQTAAIYRAFTDKKVEAEAKREEFVRETIVATIANDFSMSPENVHTILVYVENNTIQQQNLADSEMHMEALVARLKEMGVPNADQFQETPTEMKSKRSLRDNYFPELFGDEEFESKKSELLARIAAETKGQRIKDLDYYFADSTYDGSPISTSTSTSEADAPSTSVDIEKPSRWKLAYRDLSKTVVDENPDSARYVQKKTIICTRKGSLRYATPLEEAKRSWTRNPTHMDLINHREQVQRFVDFDADDHLTKQIANEKLEKRKKQKAELET